MSAPGVRVPTLPDGTVDVRAWLADLDARCNAGIDPTPRPPAAVRDGAR